MRRKRGLEARSRASGSPAEPVGQPTVPPPPQPVQPPDQRGPAWAQVGRARPAPMLPGGLVLAGTVRRMAAWVIDLIVLYVLFLPVLFLFEQVLGPIATWREDPMPSLLYTDASALVGFAYWMTLWTGGRSTVGMRILGIRVVDARDGGPLRLGSAVRRWMLFEGVTVLLGLMSDIGVWTGSGVLLVIGSAAGMLWAILLLTTTITSATNQGLHDRFGRTYVVRR